MFFDDTVLFTYLRRAPFGGRLAQDQVDGVKRLIRICGAQRVTDLRHVANVLAQVFHETGGRMQPVREAFQSSDKASKDALERAWKAGRLPWVKTPYWREGWFGRGDIQLTHKDNYRKMSAVIGVDLVSDPSKALDPEVSGKIAVIGMRDGLFTGKRLSQYFSGLVDDPKAARAIVNGSDKASLIATYHSSFLGALKAAETSTPLPVDVTPRAAEPDDVKPVDSAALKTIGGALVSAGGLSVFQSLNNPWALAAFVLILLAGGVVGWLILKGRLTINRRPADVVLNTTSEGAE